MKPILFSVSYAGYWGQQALSLEEFIPHAAELGYTGVELATKRPHLSPLDWDDARLDELAQLCADNDIEVECLAGYTNFSGGMSSVEVPFVEMQIAYIETLARMAARLGCPLVRTFTAYEREDMPPAHIWATTVTAIRECCDRAAEVGVTIGIQNHHDIAVHTKALAFMLEEIDRPNCGLMFDAWSPCLRGEDPYEIARAMAPHTVHTTFADYVRLPRSHYQPGGRPGQRRLPARPARRGLRWPRGLRDVLAGAGRRRPREPRPLRAAVRELAGGADGVTRTAGDGVEPAPWRHEGVASSAAGARSDACAVRRAPVRLHTEALRASPGSSLRELHPGPPFGCERQTTGPAWKLRHATLTRRLAYSVRLTASPEYSASRAHAVATARPYHRRIYEPGAAPRPSLYSGRIAKSS